MPRALLAVLAVLSVWGSAAWAQQPPTVRIRGTIESIDGKTLSIKTREGTDVKVNMTDDLNVIGIAKTSLSEIKQGSYIGVSAMPQPDGSQKAIAIHIFMESQRGAAEGFRPWDLRPNSTMTNATVAQTVASVDGQVIEADAVVVAAGAWASALLAPAGIQLAAPAFGENDLLGAAHALELALAFDGSPARV